MKLGYVRVSKADGSQVLDLQMDALIEAGVEKKDIYQDQASGKKDDHPGWTLPEGVKRRRYLVI